MVNTEGIIMDISTAAIYFFGLESNAIKKKNVNIESIVGDWKSDKKYTEKNGKDF